MLDATYAILSRTLRPAEFDIPARQIHDALNERKYLDRGLGCCLSLSRRRSRFVRRRRFGSQRLKEVAAGRLPPARDGAETAAEGLAGLPDRPFCTSAVASRSLPIPRQLRRRLFGAEAETATGAAV